VTAFGANPDGRGTLLRVWEQGGTAGALTVTLPAGAAFGHAQPVSLRGEPAVAALPIRDHAFTLALGAYAPASFVLGE